MALNDNIRTAVIEDLKKENILGIDMYARRNHKVLSFLYNHGIIDDSSIEGALEEAVFRQARKDYEIMTRKGRPYTIWADHVRRPDCLAYALDKSKFSRKEIRQIPFDHETNVETYIQNYGREDLLSVIREELLNPKPLTTSEGDVGLCHTCFCGG